MLKQKAQLSLGWPTVLVVSDRRLMSSKVDDFHVIGKPLCHFLLVINSNFSRISHSLRDMTGFPSPFPPLFIQPLI